MAETGKSSYLVVPGYKNKLCPEHIIWIQGEGNYSRIHLTTGKQLMIAQTLRMFEPLIPDFIRIHKSSIVNPNHVIGIRMLRGPKIGILGLTGDVELIVARRRFEKVSEKLQKKQQD